MKSFIFILLTFCFLNSHLVYASDCIDIFKSIRQKMSISSKKQIPKSIPKHVLEQSQKSVWKISDSLGSGTGFFISKNEFVTNFHVVADLLKNNSDDFALSQKDNHNTLRIKKMKHLSALSDLAVLEIEGEVSDYLNLVKKDPHSKENLSLIGYPKGKFKVINKTHDISYENKLEYVYTVKHADYHRASGSPVLNKKGEVAGIFYAISENQISVIKTIHLKNLLKQDSPFFENPKDHLEHSIKELELLAKEKNMVAQFRLGSLYANGLGMETDFKEAARLYEKAAKQEYEPAQYNLGVFYKEGRGVKKNLERMVYWFTKAAEQGLASAQFQLGVLYQEGWGVKKNLKEAVRWFRKAAKQGLAEAQDIINSSKLLKFE